MLRAFTIGLTISVLGIATAALGQASQDKELMDVFKKQIYVPTIKSGDRLPASLDVPIVQVTQKIDSLFDELIVGYPDETKFLLRRIYYGRELLSDQPGLVAEGSVAAARAVLDNGKMSFDVRVDPILRKVPTLFRLTLIHEVAVHIGQMHQRMSQVPFETYRGQREAFLKFSELTAALVEKRVSDLLPVDVLMDDLRRNIADPVTRERLMEHVRFRHKSRFDQYPWLRQRLAYDKASKEPPLPEWEIRQFVNFYETREANRR